MDLKDVFLFSWSDFSSSSFSNFEDMRRKGLFCDVKIQVGDHQFSAHRVVLAATIPYFRAMFRCNMAESAMEEVTMEEIDPLSLKHLLDFVYSITLNINTINANSLLATSMYLQLDSVTNACFKFISKHFNPMNVVKTRAFADSIENVCIKIDAEYFIRQNFDDIADTEDFLTLPYSFLKELIGRDNLNVISEEHVFEAMIKWVKANADRHSLLPELLLKIRMPLLSLEYILQKICSEELIQSSSVCLDWVREAVGYHACVEYNPMSFSFRAKERFCKEGHHLKCAKVKGCGMYSVYKAKDSKVSLCYYDSLHDKWGVLRENEKYQHFNYIVCTKEKIYFLHDDLISIFNLRTLESTTHTYPPGFSVSNAGIALHCNKIYFVGGAGVLSDSVHCLVLQQNSYSEDGKLTINRTSPSAVSLGEYIYVIGGLNDDVLCSAERYNPETGQSIEISPMITKRCDYGCCELNGKIYVCGGVSSDGNPSSAVEVYDPETDQWSLVTPMNGPMKSMSLVSFVDKLYAFKDAYLLDDDDCPVQIFDPCHEKWKSSKPKSLSRRLQELIVFVNNSTWKIKEF